MPEFEDPETVEVPYKFPMDLEEHSANQTARAMVRVRNETKRRALNGEKMKPIPQGHFKAAKAIIYAACSGDLVESLALDEIFKGYTGFSALSTGKLIDEVERVKWLEDIQRADLLPERHKRKHSESYDIEPSGFSGFPSDYAL